MAAWRASVRRGGCRPRDRRRSVDPPLGGHHDDLHGSPPLLEPTSPVACLLACLPAPCPRPARALPTTRAARTSARSRSARIASVRFHPPPPPRPPQPSHPPLPAPPARTQLLVEFSRLPPGTTTGDEEENATSSPLPAPPQESDAYVRARLWVPPESAVSEIDDLVDEIASHQTGIDEIAGEIGDARGRAVEWAEEEESSFLIREESSFGSKSQQMNAPPDNKRVRFALLAEVAQLPEGGAASSSYNSRGRRLSWSNFNFESVSLPKAPEDQAARHPPPPSSASSVSSRRSWGGASTASATEDEDELGSENFEDFGTEQLLRIPHGGAGRGGRAAPSADGRVGGATLADLQRAVHAAFGIPPALQRLVRMQGPIAELVGEAPGAADDGCAFSRLRLSTADDSQARLAVAGRCTTRHIITRYITRDITRDIARYTERSATRWSSRWGWTRSAVGSTRVHITYCTTRVHVTYCTTRSHRWSSRWRRRPRSAHQAG